MKRLLCATLAVFLLPVSGAALSQYPSKPIRILVGFPSGSAADNVTRIVGQALSQSLGQPVIIENKSGGDGAIAASAAAKSPPDGYTLCYGSASTMAAAVALRKSPPYDPVADFSHNSLIGHGTFLLFAHPSVPATTVAELIDYARSNPDRLNYATGNPTAIVATAQLMKATGIRMVNIPYKGESPALLDFVAGRVQVMFVATVASALAHAKEGRLRVLGAMLDRRSPLAPDVPTLAEAGVPAVTVRLWAGFFGPPKIPPEIVQRLSREMNIALKRPDVREQLVRQGFDAQGTTPEELASYVKDQLEIWNRAVRESRIPLE